MTAGMEAGSGKNGYRRICIAGVHYGAHRLAWLYVYGRHPAGQIDHINRNPADNRIANLRESSPQENALNRAWRSRPGIRGVRQRGSRWYARIRICGKECPLGVYDTPAEAVAAYQAGGMSLQYYLAMIRRSGASTSPPLAPDGLVEKCRD
ncbi:MAG TPA: HNH endonuclease [Xanthobacteraceae bacterium]|jgi:hypothetical protein